MHTIDRQREQLKMAGLDEVPEPDLGWATSDVSRFNLEDKFVLLIPGGALHRPGKRWPAEHYGALATWFAALGVQPVLLGMSSEQDVLQTVRAQCADACDLCDQTDFQTIVALARKAVCAIGNDTGPMHLISFTGCPTLVLYSHDSDPALCAQRGSNVTILRHASLDDLTLDEVTAAIRLQVPAIA